MRVSFGKSKWFQILTLQALIPVSCNSQIIAKKQQVRRSIGLKRDVRMYISTLFHAFLPPFCFQFSGYTTVWNFFRRFLQSLIMWHSFFCRCCRAQTFPKAQFKNPSCEQGLQHFLNRLIPCFPNSGRVTASLSARFFRLSTVGNSLGALFVVN